MFATKEIIARLNCLTFLCSQTACNHNLLETIELATMDLKHDATCFGISEG